MELQKLPFSFYSVKMFLIDHHLGNERLKRCRAEKGAWFCDLLQSLVSEVINLVQLGEVTYSITKCSLFLYWIITIIESGFLYLFVKTCIRLWLSFYYIVCNVFKVSLQLYDLWMAYTETLSFLEQIITNFVWTLFQIKISRKNSKFSAKIVELSPFEI